MLFQNATNYIRFEFWNGGSERTSGPAGHWRRRLLPPSISTASPITLGASNYLRVTRTGTSYAPATRRTESTSRPSALADSGRIHGQPGRPVREQRGQQSGDDGERRPVRRDGIRPARGHDAAGPVERTAHGRASLRDDSGHPLAHDERERVLPLRHRRRNGVRFADAVHNDGRDRALDERPRVGRELLHVLRSLPGRVAERQHEPDDFTIARSCRARSSFRSTISFSAPRSGVDVLRSGGRLRSRSRRTICSSPFPRARRTTAGTSLPNCARCSAPSRTRTRSTGRRSTARTSARRTRTTASLFQNATNYFRFEFWNGGSGTYVRAYRVVNGSGVLPPSISTASPVTLGAANSLRVTKNGNTFTLEYKIDGGPYIPAGSFTQAGFTVNQAGVFVNNAIGNPTTTANVDNFSATAGP